ncbi:hypothetical protein BX600DRAFT_167448 [Xylariales sp. PMI_506]|nr:hypothetical protein BX600DRAFT_167448 [Xylariales sp. PMI_506]
MMCIELKRPVYSFGTTADSLPLRCRRLGRGAGSPLSVCAGFQLLPRHGNHLVLVKLQASIKHEFEDAPRLSKFMNALNPASIAVLLKIMESVII